MTIVRQTLRKPIRMLRKLLRDALLWAAMCGLITASALAQYASFPEGTGSENRLAMSVDAGQHFVAVHGRRALIDGYSAQGLEAWVYPFQIFRNYRVAFRAQGATTAIAGSAILGRIQYAPDAVTRIYLGPGFIVREKLFVPLHRPGAILTYTVQSKTPIEIDAHFTPVLNLMWPAALGGQSAEWNPAFSAFVLAEPLHGFTAVVGSPQIVEHDKIGNPTVQDAGGRQIGFTLRPGSDGKARVFVALNPAHAADEGALLRALIQDRRKLEADAAAHYTAFSRSVIHVETPDERVNQAIGWAETALDQAWVCNPRLGCGFVAGYGPSRGARRPQYAWFFAGDGLIAADGALAAGDASRARDELAFILKYQNQKSGMIWHELSQSAGLIDWAGKYPYMFVHVDVTFQFLGMLARYVAETGDVNFVKQHWQAIDAAYRYCVSLIDPETGLPRIPAGKEGADEQDRLSDDLGLSASWVAASSGFAHLAAVTGHDALAAQARAASRKARAAIPGRYWDAKESFWINGHTAAGKPIVQRRSGPGDAITLHLFPEDENTPLLDQLASAEFQTDWGTRSLGAGSAEFDPDSYAKGSVWPVATAALAQAFWSEHRPLTALGIWRALVPLDTLDSLGHMDEVLNGEVYRPQAESVPEQTWSSAGFLEAAIRGLLGLRVDAGAHRMIFAPRLSAGWDHLSVSHVELGGAPVSFKVSRSAGSLTLHIENSGSTFGLDFAPELPLGAKLTGITFAGQRVNGAVKEFPQETAANVRINVPHGSSDLEFAYSGGILIKAPSERPKLGDASTGIRIIHAALSGSRLRIDADVPAARASRLLLTTAWKLAAAGKADVQQIGPHSFEINFVAAPGPAAYSRVHLELVVDR